MTRSKRPTEAPATLLDAASKAASKDAKTSEIQLSEEELKSVSGGKHVSNIKWTPN
jgi:bacteriocin-like protein